jgi:hypothetical protein
MIMLKKQVTLGILCFILLASLVILAVFMYQQHLHKPNILSQERLEDLRKEYPAYNEDPPSYNQFRSSSQANFQLIRTTGNSLDEFPDDDHQLSGGGGG